MLASHWLISYLYHIIGDRDSSLVHVKASVLQDSSGLDYFINKRTLPFLVNDSFRCNGDGFAITENMPVFMSKDSMSWFHECLLEMNLPKLELDSATLTNSFYRVQTILWGANRALAIEGDFVDFGVWHGILPYSLNKKINLKKHQKTHYLFDTWGDDWENHRDPYIEGVKPRYNEDIFADVVNRFSKFPCVKCVRGLLPGSAVDALSEVEKIAYACIDVNSHGILAGQLLELIWDKLSVGSMIFFDDYGYRKYPGIPKVINQFLAEKQESIFELANGTAFVLKS